MVFLFLFFLMTNFYQFKGQQHQKKKKKVFQGKFKF
jgi:hypothetical protein